MALDKSKAVKYIVLFIVCLLIMLLGSSVMVLAMARPFKTITGYDGETINKAIELFQNYFSSKQCTYDNTYTWNEYAVMYFDADPILFKDVKIFFCTLQFLSYVPLIILIVYFLRTEFAEDFIKFKKNVGRNFMLVLIGIFAMYAASMIVGLIYKGIGITGDSNNESIIVLLLNSPGIWLMAVAVVLIAPVVEEVIFRKLLFGTCEVTCHFPPVVAIILSSLVFSFIHVSDLESLKFIFQYLALAIPMCVIYHISGNNIYVTIIMHIINNLLSVIITLSQL